jgi:chromosome segregation ATPase
MISILMEIFGAGNSRTYIRVKAAERAILEGALEVLGFNPKKGGKAAVAQMEVSLEQLEKKQGLFQQKVAQLAGLLQDAQRSYDRFANEASGYRSELSRLKSRIESGSPTEEEGSEYLDQAGLVAEKLKLAVANATREASRINDISNLLKTAKATLRQTQAQFQLLQARQKAANDAAQRAEIDRQLAELSNGLGGEGAAVGEFETAERAILLEADTASANLDFSTPFDAKFAEPTRLSDIDAALSLELPPSPDKKRLTGS